MDSSSFTVMSLCAGIGGLDLGIKLAVPSARTVCMVEREAFAVATLVAKMEEGYLDPCPIWTDLTRFDGKAWRGTVDCIVGGYPCQPFSVAGRRAGDEDPRHLFPHIARIVEQVQPAVVFFENVAGHLSLGFEEVAERLQCLGYAVAAGIFSAEEVGAPHRRERLFILAYSHQQRCEGKRLDWLFDGERPTQRNDVDGCGRSAASMEYSESVRLGERRTEPEVRRRRGSSASAGSAMADADQPRLQERQSLGGDAGAEQPTAVGGSVGVWPPVPSDIDAWRCLPERIAPAIKSDFCGVADGNASRVDRLRALGNGVVPVVAAYAFRTLAKAAGLQ